MGDTYNELIANSETIKDTLLMEETRFRETLSNGIEILNQEIPKISNSTLDGKIAFKLYDTYGFPLDLTQDFLKLKKIKVDTDGFNQAMEAQKEEARTSWKGSGDQGTQKLWFDLAKKIKPTVFVGYEQSSNEAEISCILSDFKEKSEVSPNNINVIVLTNQSCFYAESGGQIGDRGFIKTDTGTFKVQDTKKNCPRFISSFWGGR
jgi:alanyl-tRNA synthetase